jgi:ribosome maturation factor RimP
MISQEDIERELKGILTETQFIVDVKINNRNEIVVHVDDYQGLNIDACRSISKQIYKNLEGRLDDYSIEISSPGLSNPFVVIEQYKKNIGKEVEILMKDGKKIKRKIVSVDNDTIIVETIEKPRSNSRTKDKEPMITEETINLSDIKSTKNIISFK